MQVTLEAVDQDETFDPQTFIDAIGKPFVFRRDGREYAGVLRSFSISDDGRTAWVEIEPTSGDTHEVPRSGSLHATVDWLTAHGQRVAGPFGAMGVTPAIFWTPAGQPNSAARMAVPGDLLQVTPAGTVVVVPR